MSNYRIRGTNGTYHPISQGAIQNLLKQLRGTFLWPDTPGYDEARNIWNGMIDKRPGLIVRCTGTADVVESINFAREHELLISIRSGGHNIAGTSLCDDGMTIDLSMMKGIRVDPDNRRVWVQPGNNLGDLDHATQLHGLIVPGGIVSTTGIAGYTLGGGFGWLTRKWGYTSDWLRAVEMVTWEGQVINATRHNHSDLFWALTGGGGNFGIVTGFEFEALPLGPTVMAGIVFHPMDQATAVIDLFRDVTRSAPEELTCLLITRLAPPLPFIPPDMRGKPVVAVAVSYAGPVEEAAQYVRPIKEFGSPIVDTIAPKPFIEHQSFLDAGQPDGRCYYWKSDYLDRFSDELVDVTLDHSAHFSSPMSAVLVMHLGGAARRVPSSATAVTHRDAEYIYVIQASWESVADSDQHINWAREFYDAVKPYSSGGTYVNFLNADDGEDRTRQAYDSQTYERLVEVKNRYDPQNNFRLNKNIRPATAEVPGD
jgi:FAD/FMN-containing dehydrogenase